ncbi:MAG: alpha/beta hydrolase-fold protein, partial [Acidobacteriota bacterium]
LLATPAPAQNPPALLSAGPRTEERGVPIEALKAQGPSLAEAFAAKVHTNDAGATMPYRLYTPTPLVQGARYPLVVFLHGSGGAGADNARQLQRANMFGALIWTLPENQKRHPAYVLAPETDASWACIIPDPNKQARKPADLTPCPLEMLGAGEKLAFELIDALLATLPIDRNRIYVTGHSMGGAGTWHMLYHRPAFFAAGAPVCGHPDPAMAATLKDVPIWNFHGDADEIEPVATSRVTIEALRKVGGRPLHTEYPGVGHNVFMWAYTEPALVEWLFAQSR